jgi:pimeloyl-ACP methyl ester carboxylesterase
MTHASHSIDAIAIDDVMVASDTPGIVLHLRHKRLPANAPFSAERTVVLVHGATYSSGSLFDVRLGGLSFMDYLALEGFDVYGLDVRGYGSSTRPPEMAEPPQNHPPIGRTETGTRDLTSAIRFVIASNGLDRVSLMGMPWGGSVAGAYASRNHDSILRLALVAPQWLRHGPGALDAGGPLGAYRSITVADMEARWRGAAPEDKRAGLIPAGWFEAWTKASLATDPDSAPSGTMRAVNGPILDVRDYWSAGRPFYDPGAITVPVLLVHAEWDTDVRIDAAQAYFATLRQARYRRWVEIGEGTHMILNEKNRLQAFRAISTFLSEDEPLVK